MAPAGHSAGEADEDMQRNGEQVEAGMRSQGRRTLVAGTQDAWVGSRVALQEGEPKVGEVGSSWEVEVEVTIEVARE